MTDLAVIMSVYINDKIEFVKESIESILDQSFTPFHFYLVIDGPVSTEIDHYIGSIQDERILLYRLDRNKGLAVALNYLLKIVLDNNSYKYIARMDADDISANDRFKEQIKFLEMNPEIACVGSWYREIDENGKTISNQKLPTQHEDIIRFFYRRCPMAHPSVMFRTRLIEKAGLYPTDTLRLEDYVFWSNAIKNGFKLANIPEYHIKFRIDKNFYRRRSGIIFGYNYILTRFKINYNIKAPFYVYFYSVFIGIVRMMPAGVIRRIYRLYRSELSQRIKHKLKDNPKVSEIG